MVAWDMLPIRIFLLGRFEIASGEQVLRTADWPRRKAASLLQRLALERRLVKEQAIDFLWPDADPTSGANNLYRTLHVLRQTLDSQLGAGTAETLLSFQGGVLSLGELVGVDVYEFERLGNAGLSEKAEAQQANHLEQALSLYRGELLLDDPYSEWTIAPRERLRRLYREATLALAAWQRDGRRYEAAIVLITRLVEQDPTDEVAHRELMRLYTLAGRRHESLRQYQACVQVLANEWGVEPDRETEALYQQIVSGKLSPPPAPAPVPGWMPPAPIAVEVERAAPLAGRDVELESLRQQMHHAWRGRGRALLIAGDSGLGKTRLAYEALRAAAASGMTTLFGAAYEQEGQLPYQPYIEAFDRYLAERQRPAEQNPITHFQRSGSSDPQQEHWALFNTTAAFLAALGERAPIVLLVDDLHAADETSLHLFHFLARQTRSVPLVLLATYRTDLISQPGSAFHTLLNALYREHLSDIMNLTALSEQATAAILAHLFQGPVAPELAEAIFNSAEGNPFYTQEIGRALLRFEQVEKENGRWRLLPGTELGIPSGLHELLRERVRRLGSPAETALTAAAVAGREFSFEVLRGLVAPATALADGELLDALDDALAGSLLEETSAGYRFRHSLIRRTLYDALNRPRRQRLHTLAAQAIESSYTTRPEGLTPYVEAIAFHYELSDCRACALPYLLQAGQKAAGLFAFEVAVSYFERALALMDELGIQEPAQRWMVLEPLGWWGIILADTPRAVGRFEQALALPTSEEWQPGRHDQVRLHRGATMALLTAGDTEAAEQHLTTALQLIEEDKDAADYAFLLYNVAQLHWHRNEYQEASDVAQRSLAIAERLNDPVAIARAFEMLALACHSLGEWQLGRVFEEQRTSLAGPALDVTEAFDVHL
jgi:DNA-binding SARP family transcriptional activator